MIKIALLLVSLLVISNLMGCAVATQPSTKSSQRGELHRKSGRLERDEIWSGEVRISGELVIPREISVTVMPGTLVRFEPSADQPGRIIVVGSLYAQGGPDNPVIFNSAAVIPRPGDWDGLCFVNRGMSSALSFSIIQYHRRIYINTDAVRISDCLINYAKEAGIIVDGASPKLTNLSISQSDIGIHCINGALPEISQSTITMNGYGILCESGSSPTISNSVIANNRMHGVVCYTGSSPKLISNNIIHNGGWAVYGGGRLIDNFIMGNNKRPPDEVETGTTSPSKQYQQVEEISGIRSSPVPYAGVKREGR